MEDNLEYLQNTLGKDKYKIILNLSNSDIKSSKNDILQKLQLSGKDLKDTHKKLKGYRYITNIDEFNHGAYIRWIPIEKVATKGGEIKLTNGGIITSLNYIVNNDNENDVDAYVRITVKNNINRFFTILSDSCIIFQKLNDEEQMLLKLVDYLNK